MDDEHALPFALIAELMRPADQPKTASARRVLQEREQAILADALATLSWDEQALLRLRFTDGDALLYDEIAAQFLSSPAIIQQREQTALTKLRALLPTTRADLVALPTIQYLPIAQKGTQHVTIQKRKKGGYHKAFDRRPIYAYLDTHPDTRPRDLMQQFPVSEPSAGRFIREWREQRKPSPILPEPNQPVSISANLPSWPSSEPFAILPEETLLQPDLLTYRPRSIRHPHSGEQHYDQSERSHLAY